MQRRNAQPVPFGLRPIFARRPLDGLKEDREL
jgi:hypothetical protein